MCVFHRHPRQAPQAASTVDPPEDPPVEAVPVVVVAVPVVVVAPVLTGVVGFVGPPVQLEPPHLELSTTVPSGALQTTERLRATPPVPPQAEGHDWSHAPVTH